MKIFKKISWAVAIAATVASSCNKLDEDNPSGTTDDAIWSTPDGFMTVVNASYHYIHNWYGVEDGMFLCETGTDLWTNTIKNLGYVSALSRYEALTPSLNTTKNAWNNTWIGINLCNSGIAAIDKAGFTDPAEKNRRLGELRFMRALHYYNIVETFGGVMLRTTPTDGAELTATRSKPEEFYDLMISDLLFAKDNLPVSWAAAEYMRASKKSAMGLLARAYLTRAYYSTGAEANAWFTKAKDAALELLNNRTAYNCEMAATPADLWNPNNNKGNKESLFSINWSATNTAYNVGGANGNRLYKWWQTPYVGRPGISAATIEYGNDGDQKLMPTWHMLDLFDETKDARYSASFQEAWKATSAYTWVTNDINTYKKDPAVLGQVIPVGDTCMFITKNTWDDKLKRKYLAYDRTNTYLTPIPGQGSKINPDPLYNTYYVNFKKFADYTRTAIATSGGYNDFFVIRLAEMYMIAAEANFQLGDNNSAATNINDLRKRAAKPGQVDAFKVTASDINLQFILDERAREFCGEMQRWYDLKRVFRGDDFPAYIKKWNLDITGVQTFHRLRPIPQTELETMLNGAEFGQNPGYQ